MRKFVLFAPAAAALILFAVSSGFAAAEKTPYGKDPASCAKCHVLKPYVDSWGKSDFLDHAHQKAGIGCAECHQLTAQEQKQNVSKFNRKAFTSPLKEREYPNDFCLRCHGSYKDVAARTKDFKAKGLTRNPHESHYGEVDCNLCHKSHRDSIDYCAQCHPPLLTKPGWKSP